MSQGNSENSGRIAGKVNRREYVGALTAATSGLIAGCQSGPSGTETETESPGSTSPTQGDSTEESRQLGERVPTYVFSYATGLGDTTKQFADSVPMVREALNALGVHIEVVPKDISAIGSDLATGKRSFNMSFGTSTLTPAALEPYGELSEYHIRTAGANGRFSWTQYADCEASRLIEQLRVAPSQEAVRDLSHQILSVVSEDIVTVPLFNRVVFGAHRTDQVNMPDPGRAGVQDTNPDVILDASSKGDHPLSMNIDANTIRTNNPITAFEKTTWNQFFNSTLIRYDKNWQLTGSFATDWEISDDFQTVTFELREGHTAHNGEPITAEDVKWIYEYMDANSDGFQDVQDWPYGSIDVVDDQTVTFNFTRPTAGWLRRAAPQWGIVPKDVWIEQGAKKNPTEFQLDEIIGSGPYRVATWERGRLLVGEPFEDHWNTPSDSIQFVSFQDVTSMSRAFRQGELNLFVGIPPGVAQDIEDMDQAKVTVTQGFLGYYLTPIQSFGPSKFREFRLAMSQAINRKRTVELATFGTAHPILHSATQFSKEWPMYPDDHEGILKIADSETGNIDKAKQILRDEGWDWDDQGRLHYPPDADLSPVWPQGKTPKAVPEKFPCVDELGDDGMITQ